MEQALDVNGEQGSRWERLQFTGKGGEYFKIWIVNIFLSILTLGIYSAWAKVRTLRYLYGNTWLDSASFDYHAKPIAILKGRIIAVVVLAVVLLLGQISPIASIASFIVIGLLTPFVIWRSIIFTARMSSYRNVRFGFEGKVGALYRYLLLLPLLPVLAAIAYIAVLYGTGGIDFSAFLNTDEGQPAPPGAQTLSVAVGLAVLGSYLLIPYIQKAVTAYYLNGHRFGQGKFRARLSAGKYYLIYLTLFGLGLLAYLFVAVVFGGLYYLFSDQLTALSSGARTSGSSPLILVGFTAAFIPVIMVGIWIKSWLVSRVRNYSLSKLRLDSAVSVRSRIKVNRLFWIQFSNLILLVITIGLAYPWTIIRVTRYKMETLYAHLHGDLGEYVTQMQQRQSALGEEVGEAFDLDLDLGI